MSILGDWETYMMIVVYGLPLPVITTTAVLLNQPSFFSPLLFPLGKFGSTSAVVLTGRSRPYTKFCTFPIHFFSFCKPRAKFIVWGLTSFPYFTICADLWRILPKWKKCRTEGGCKKCMQNWLEGFLLRFSSSPFWMNPYTPAGTIISSTG